MKTNFKQKTDYEKVGLIIMLSGIIGMVLILPVEYYYISKQFYLISSPFFEYLIISLCTFHVGFGIFFFGTYQYNREWVRQNDILIQELKRKNEQLDKIIAILEAENFLATLLLKKARLKVIIANKMN